LHLVDQQIENEEIDETDRGLLEVRPFCEELKAREPHVLLIQNFFFLVGAFFIGSNFKNYGITKIPDDRFLNIVGSVSGVTNGLSRLVT
jgi:hypothetical protein